MSWNLVQLSDFLVERDERINFHDANKLGLQRIKKIDFSGQIYLENHTETKTEMIRVCSGDLVISGINASKGAITIYSDEPDVLATIHYSSYQFNSDLISVDFLIWFFKSHEFSQLLKNQVAGGIKTELKPKHILPLKVKIPPLNEQIIIAKRLNTFSNARHKIDLNIEEQKFYINLLKEKTIQEALLGNLSKHWREGAQNILTGKSLINEIKDIRNNKFGELKARGGKELHPISDDDLPFQIPSSWCWCRLGDLIEEKPRNGLSLKPVDYETKTKTLKLSATTSGKFDQTQFKYLNVDIESSSYLWLRDGDILIQRANSLDLVGTSAIYRGENNQFIYPDLMMKIRAVKNEITNYLQLVLSSNLTKRYFKKNASGAAGNMPKINQEIVINSLIPIPPLEEQKIIIEKIEKIFLNILEFSKEIEQINMQVKTLNKSVVSKEFRKVN